MSTRWNQFAKLLGLPEMAAGVTMLRSMELVADLARKAHQVAVEHDARLLLMAQQVLLEVDEDDYTGASSRLEAVARALQLHLTRAELAVAVIQQVALQSKLDGKGGPVTEEMRVFITERLGDKSASEQDVALEYDTLLGEMRRLASLATQLTPVESLAQRLADSGAVNLAQQVRTQVLSAAGDDTALPYNWREA